MTTTVTKTYSFGGPLFLLFLVFLTLKLTGHISWSWLWVTVPLWGPWALLAAILLMVVLIALILDR